MSDRKENKLRSTENSPLEYDSEVWKKLPFWARELLKALDENNVPRPTTREFRRKSRSDPLSPDFDSLFDGSR
jgi:hypothetical protein